MQKAESIAGEKNRALKATLNAELRKERQLLKEELGDLEKLARVGGADVQREKRERFEEAKRAVENVPDSTSAMAKPQWTAGSDHESGKSSRSIELKGSLSRMQTYEETAASSQFAKEARQARQRQDVALEHIEQGVTTLKELGQAMGEEVERHDRMIDDVGAKMDRVAKELQTNNMKLKGLVTKIRSTRRFFIDIILICVLLALGLYVYNPVKG